MAQGLFRVQFWPFLRRHPKVRRHSDGGSDFNLPERCSWRLWRLLVSEHFRVASIADLERDWSIDDVAIANELLDEFEYLEAEARKPPKE